jgi:recombination protein RecT
MNEKPELAKINRAEVIQGLCKAAFLGLDFMNKECYLIPYGNSVQFQTDYKGEKKFVKNYSIRPIKDIYAKVVREGDFFEERILDGQPTVDFKPLPFNNGKIIGAFAVVLYVDGGMEYETMSTEDINSVRNNYSKASQSKAWKYSFDEMAKKTVLRRLCKHIETDFESIEARNTWDEASGMEFSNTNTIQHDDNVVDVFGSSEVEEIKVTEVEDISDMPMPECFV